MLVGLGSNEMSSGGCRRPSLLLKSTMRAQFLSPLLRLGGGEVYTYMLIGKNTDALIHNTGYLENKQKKWHTVRLTSF